MAATALVTKAPDLVSFDRSSPFTGQFRRPAGLRWMILAWLVAEVVAFSLLVHALGLGGTLLLGLATTVLGILRLRQLGSDTVRSLRQAAVAGMPAAGSGGLADGLLQALGAVLLIVPGFLANAVGLGLSAPSGRRAVIARFDPARPGRAPLHRPARTDVIDLGPGDWTPVDRN